MRFMQQHEAVLCNCYYIKIIGDISADMIIQWFISGKRSLLLQWFRKRWCHNPCYYFKISLRVVRFPTLDPSTCWQQTLQSWWVNQNKVPSICHTMPANGWWMSITTYPSMALPQGASYISQIGLHNSTVGFFEVVYYLCKFLTHGLTHHWIILIWACSQHSDSKQLEEWENRDYATWGGAV